MVSGEKDGTIRIFDLKTKFQLHCLQNAHNGIKISLLLYMAYPFFSIAEIRSVDISYDNNFLVSGSKDKSIRLYDLKINQFIDHLIDAHIGFLILILQLNTDKDEINSVKITNDNKFIVSASKDKSIKVFSLQKKQETYQFLDVHEGIVIQTLLLLTESTS